MTSDKYIQIICAVGQSKRKTFAFGGSFKLQRWKVMVVNSYARGV